MKWLAVLAIALSSAAIADDRAVSLDAAAEAVFKKHWPSMQADPQTSNISANQFRALSYWAFLADSFGYCHDYGQPDDKKAWQDSINRLGLDEIVEMRFYANGMRAYGAARTQGLTDDRSQAARARYCATELPIARQKLAERVTLPASEQRAPAEPDTKKDARSNEASMSRFLRSQLMLIGFRARARVLNEMVALWPI